MYVIFVCVFGMSMFPGERYDERSLCAEGGQARIERKKAQYTNARTQRYVAPFQRNRLAHHRSFCSPFPALREEKLFESQGARHLLHASLSLLQVYARSFSLASMRVRVERVNKTRLEQ